MFNKLKKYYLILFIVLLSGTSYAQWFQQNGPRGSANILYADSDIVFSYIDSSRIYKTSPGSDNWVEAHNGIPGDFYIQSLIKVGTNFLVTASSADGVHTVFISNDEGANWAQTSLELPYIASYLSYVDNVIFVAANTSSGSPLHYSADQGVTWHEANGMVANGLTSILKYGLNIYASTNLGVFVSVDSGVNWVKKNSDGIPAFSSFSIMVHNFGSGEEKIYGLISGFASMIIYSSTDEGDTWVEETSSGLPGGGGEYFYSTPILSQENIYIILTQDASTILPTIYTTNDFGLTWTQLGIPPFYAAHQLYIGGGAVYVGTTSGILKSEDWGASWSEFSSGLIYNGNTRGFALANRNLFTTFENGVYSIGAYPGEWAPVTLPDSTITYSEILSQNNILFLYSFSGIFKSEDAGDTWIDISGSLPANFFASAFKAGDSKIFLAGQLNSERMLYFSDDAGATWNSNTVPVTFIASIEVVGNTVYVKSDKLYKTTDDGATWMELGTTGISDPSRINAYTESNGRIIVFIWDISNPQVLYSDDGNSWSVATGLGDGNTVNSFYTDDNLVFAATNNGVFLSSDDGKTWVSKSDGIGAKSVSQIYSTGKYYVASVWDRAVWFISKPNITGIENSDSEIPKSFTLKQNYPNPFNPSTTFSFSIPNRAFVSLAIYSTLGEKVANVVSKNLQAGNYKFNWSANHLTSGVYFARLTAGTNTQVQKIMLLK